jgi:aspartokinase/homoserine dehydrogenase 1
MRASSTWQASIATCHDIEGILHTVKLTRSASTSVRDLIAGYGEIWSTKLFREFFTTRKIRPGEVRWIDARQAVVVQWGPLGPAVQVGRVTRQAQQRS